MNKENKEQAEIEILQAKLIDEKKKTYTASLRLEKLTNHFEKLQKEHDDLEKQLENIKKQG